MHPHRKFRKWPVISHLAAAIHERFNEPIKTGSESDDGVDRRKPTVLHVRRLAQFTEDASRL